MKKILSVVGARPNFMKVAPIHRAFEKYKDDYQHLIVHTGQHYDVNMSDAFFQDLEMPQPAYFLDVRSGSHAEQTAKIILKFEETLKEVQPDLVIVVGDVNSTIACTLTAVKMGIKTAHVESGLRSFDRSMPEEINRMATDAIVDYLFITEDSAMQNLKREGHPDDKIFFVGNTMIDSQHFAMPKVKKSQIINNLGLKEKDYVLITMHRPSNVDTPEQLESMLKIFKKLARSRKVVWPVHPRTKKNIDNFNLSGIIDGEENIKFIEPLGYIDFMSLMVNSDFVMTDSGGIQEETTAIGVPCLTVRTTTERPSTIEQGTNILVDPVPETISQEIDKMLNEPRKTGSLPPLWDGKAAHRIAETITRLI